MRLLNALSAKLRNKSKRQGRLEQAPSPSAIYEAVGNLDRQARKQDKMEYRRAHRLRAGVTDSLTRQILVKVGEPRRAAERERIAEEDRRYGVSGAAG